MEFASQFGSRELSAIFYQLAIRVTMTAGSKKKILNPFFYEYYNRKLKEGKTKKQAIKSVERRLVNIIYGMMKNRTEYINPPTADFQEEK